MKTIVIGDCQPDRILTQVSPEEPSESEFEAAVVQALNCVFREKYACVVFRGTFAYEGFRFQPDLALVARDFSHWFVLEVELVSHSLIGHVVPQVRAFRYGRPLPDCSFALAKALGIDVANADTLVNRIPYGVGVISNKRHREWEIMLKGLDVSVVVVTAFQAASGMSAFEVDGTFQMVQESIGFGKYLAAERSIFLHGVRPIPAGHVVVHDTEGAAANWEVVVDSKHTWLTHANLPLAIADGQYVQIIRTMDGRLMIRVAR